jgi:hypothetical protein
MKETIESTGLRASASVKVTDTQDGVVLLDVQQGLCFPLDQVGTLIWKRLEQGNQVVEVAQHIAETYQIPIQQALTDVQEFVQQLLAQRLVLGSHSDGQEGSPGWLSAVGHFCRRFAQRHFARGA